MSLCKIRKFLSTGAARSSGILFPSRFHPLICQVFAERLRHQALFEEIGLQDQELVYSSNFMVYTVKLTNARENSTVLPLKLKKKKCNLMKNTNMTPDWVVRQGIWESSGLRCEKSILYGNSGERFQVEEIARAEILRWLHSRFVLQKGPEHEGNRMSEEVNLRKLIQGTDHDYPNSEDVAFRE